MSTPVAAMATIMMAAAFTASWNQMRLRLFRDGERRAASAVTNL